MAPQQLVAHELAGALGNAPRTLGAAGQQLVQGMNLSQWIEAGPNDLRGLARKATTPAPVKEIINLYIKAILAIRALEVVLELPLVEAPEGDAQADTAAGSQLVLANDVVELVPRRGRAMVPKVRAVPLPQNGSWLWLVAGRSWQWCYVGAPQRRAGAA